MKESSSLVPSLARLMLIAACVLAAAPASATDAKDTAGTLRQAEQLLQQRHWAEARDVFDKVDRRIAEEARRALRGAVNCSIKLHDWEDAGRRIEVFVRDRTGPAHRDESRFDEEEGDFGWVIPNLELARELLVEVGASLAAHPHLEEAERRQELLYKQIQVDFRLVDRLLGPYFTRKGNWVGSNPFPDWWWEPQAPGGNGDLDPNQGWRPIPDRGIPLDPYGRPRFLFCPDRYSSTLTRAQKILALLQEIERIDPNPDKQAAAKALLKQAQVRRVLYGPATDPGWDNAEFYYADDERPSFLKSYRGGALKPFWKLADNEARALVAGRVQVIDLPDAESPLALLRLLERKYPHSSSVVEAIYERGVYYQSRQQFAQALDEYRRLQKAYPKHPRSRDAQKKIDAILHADVLLGRTGFYPAGDKPTLWFAHRQTERVEFTARPFDLPRLLRAQAKVENEPWRLRYFSENFLPSSRWGNEAEAMKALAPYLGKDSFTWSESVPRAEHVTTQATRAPLTAVGAYLVEARIPGRTQTSRGLVILTDVILVSKEVAGNSVVYVAQAQTGRPAAGQEVHLYAEKDHKWHEIILKTNQDGIIETKLKGSDYGALAMAVSTKGGLGVTALRLGSSQPEERQPVNYAITDRPVYRAGDTVHFRLWLRTLKDRTYERPRAGQPVTVEIHDPQSNLIRTLKLGTDRFGGVTGDFVLSPEPALGTYTITTQAASMSYGSPGGQFRVEMYKKPEFEVTVQAVENPVRTGSKARFRIAARYYFGGPVSRGTVHYQVFRESYEATPRAQPYDWLYGPGYGQYGYNYPWLGDATSDQPFDDTEDDDYLYRSEGYRQPIRSGEALLDSNGTAEVEIDTAALGLQDQRLTLEAEVRDSSRRTIQGKGSVVIARQELNALLTLDRPWYRPDCQAQVEVDLQSFGGTPASGKGTLRLARIHYEGVDNKQVRLEWTEKWEVTAAADGRISQRLPFLTEGQYRIEFLSDKSSSQQSASHAVFWVHGRAFKSKQFRYADLEILPDQRTYKVGETAHLLVHVAQPNARILWSDDARDGRLRTYRFIDVLDHVAVIPVRIEARQVPNFFVEATVVSRGQVHVEACELLVLPVQELLQVQIQTNKEVYRPGENGTARIIVSDASGKPVSGQLTLTAYDKSVTYIEDENGTRPRVLITRQKVQHQPDRQELWRFEASGSFVCPEFHIYGDSHRQIGAMGGAPPSGGDIQGQAPEGGDPARSALLARLSLRRGPAGEREPGVSAEPIIRRHFADTAVWQAALTLGRDGAAVVKLPWPESLTTWRLHGYALTEATQVGDATAEARTSKDLLVRLQTPRFLVEGDQVVLSANVNNGLPGDQRVTGELVLPAALFAGPQAGQADAAGNLHLRTEGLINSGGSRRFDWPVQVLGSGTATITVKAVGQDESDAMQLTVPLLPYGVRQEQAGTGAFRPGETASQTARFTLPEKFDLERTSLEVSLSPGPLGAMIDALPMLIGYPYGCTEQTMSRFYPTIIAANTLKKLGTDLEALARLQKQDNAKLAGRFDSLPAAVYDSAELKRMAEAGLDRLHNFQHQDSGWGWWQDDASSPYMTAYVVTGLQIAGQAGLEVRPQVLDYAYYYLFRTIDPHGHGDKTSAGTQDSRTDVYIAYALSWAVAHRDEPGGMRSERFDADNRRLLQELRSRLFRQRAELNSYGLALLALAMHYGKEDAPAKELTRSLLQRLQQDEKTGTAHLMTADRGWWHWWNSDIETNAWALRALLQIDSSSASIPRLARWLVLNRQHGSYWRSTRDSALAVTALAEYLMIQKAAAADCQVTFRLDGHLLREATLRPDNFLSPEHHVVIDGGQLGPGPHTLSLEKTGRGELYYGWHLQTFAKPDTIEAAGKGLSLKREYFLLGADGSPRTLLRDGSAVLVGQVIEAAITIDADSAYDYLAFEDPKPPGCEPVQLQSGGLWLDWSWTNIELRDDKVAFFVPYLDGGRHVLRYRLRAETPGLFRVLPTTGFAMYAPEIHATSAGFRLGIRDK